MDIGQKIKNLRVQQGLTQEELADRSELTKGFISQVERNLTSPSVSTLLDMLEALGTTPQKFFSKSNSKIVFNKDDYYESIKENNYILNWIVPNAQKNSMEPIIYDLEPSGETKKVLPFEGEMLGYVIDGKVNLYYGEDEYIIKKGETFYLKANKITYLKNESKEKAKIICVASPPNF